jgi:hypothetical protein
MELPDILWIVFNSLLIIYTIFLIIYGKCIRKKDSLSFRNYIDDNKVLYRNDSNMALSKNEINDKSENLLE